MTATTAQHCNKCCIKLKMLHARIDQNLFFYIYTVLG